MLSAVMKAILAGSGGGGAPSFPSFVNTSFDFTNPAKMTFSSGTGGVGSVLASITSNDGLYTANLIGTGLTLAMSNGRLITNFNGAGAMQVLSAMGLATSGQGAVLAVVEPNTTQPGLNSCVFCCSTPATTYSKNQYRLMVGPGVPGIAAYKSDGSGSFQGVYTANAVLTAGTGPRIMAIRGFSGTSAAEFALDGGTPVAGPTGAAPSGMTQFCIGAEVDSGAISGYAKMNLTRIDICLTAPTNTQLTQYNTWVWATYPDVYGKPLAAAVIQSPVIAPLTAGATSVTVTNGQIVGYPVPTATLALSVNGALISSNYTSGAAIAALNNGDRVDVVQTGTNLNGSGTNAALTVVVGAPAYAGVVNGIGVSGQPLGIYVPGVTNVPGMSITAYQWYLNAPGFQNTTGQQPWSTASTPVFPASAVGLVPSCKFVVNGVTYSTPTFGNVLPANVAGLAVGINPIPRTTPMTGTRPSGNTGTGIYAANGEIYDSSNTRLTLRGVDASHWDTDLALTTARALNPNVIRIFVDYTQNFATTNKLLMDVMVANHVVPMPTFPSCNCSFTGSISAGVLTVTAISVGNLAITQTITVGGVAVGTIASFGGSGAGKLGTYPLTGGVNTASTTMYASAGTSGSQEPTVMAGAVSTWIDQVANWSTYDQHSIINLANEWGPLGSATNTVWRDSYITQIARIRAAGYRGCVVIDAGGSGQDSYGPLNHFAAILAADPQHNVICSVHMYGFYPVGAAAPLLQQLNAVSSSTGACYVIGEFGPGNNIGPSPTNIEPLEIVYAADACNIGWIAWAYDDHGTSSPPDNNSWFGMVYNWYSGFQTGNVADLEYYGQKIVADPIKGLLTTAVKTSV